MTKTTKATARQARATSRGVVFNPNHDTDEKVRAAQPHIDSERMKDNLYFRCFTDGTLKTYKGGEGGFNSIATEKQTFIEIYGKGLEARNERYTHEGHSDRCRTMQSFLKDPKTAPIESIFQIGNCHTDIPREAVSEALQAAFKDFYREVRKNYKDNLIPLDISLHMDEATPHIHFRYTLGALDKYGYFVPNQNAALSQMGIERPDPNKAQSRYNNPLITFSDQTRELFYQCCEKQGFIIDREVENPSRRQEEIHIFKFKKLQEDVDRLEREVKENETRAQEGRQALTQTREQLSALNGYLERIEQSRKELEQEVAKLTYKKNDAQIDVHNLKVTLDKLQAAIKAAQQRYQEVQAQAEAEVEKLAALEQHAKGEYKAYDGKTIKKFDTIEAKPEKKNLFGKVTQEATPRMYLVDADQLDRAEQALGHVWINEYNNQSIKDLEKKLTESEAVQELQQQLQEREMEINRLTGLNEKQARDIKRKDTEIGNRDMYLMAIGKKEEYEESQMQSQSQHRRMHR